MKKFWILCAASGFLYACGDNNVGNRTYDLNTTMDSANEPIHRAAQDTTPTSNNNIYNPDSLAGKGTTYDNGPNESGAKRKVPGQPATQQ